MTRTRNGWAGAAGLVVALAVAGCAGSGGDESTAFDSAVEQRESGGAATADHSSEAAGEAAPADGAVPVGFELTAQARDVVQTGSLHVTVDEVDDRAPEVRAATVNAGGFVADEQLRSDDDAADLTLRVPAAAFDEVRAAVSDLGDVTSQDTDARDVTAELVDLEGRITSQRASVERVRALLAESGDVVQLATVEGELATREAELESLLGQQRLVEDQVAMSTLTVHLREEAAAVPAGDAPAGFRDGLASGWDTFVDAGRALSAAGGYALPFAVPVAVGLIVVHRWMRRDRPATP